MMEDCRALCLAGSEDFGLTPVEAQAAGKPVVAYAAGGALGTVDDGVTGIFFTERSPDSVLRAIRQVDALDTSPQVIAEHAERFSLRAFAEQFCSVVERALAEHTAAPPWRIPAPRVAPARAPAARMPLGRFAPAPAVSKPSAAR
jgi:glycosyltransferase involved in cell wall biosynthesis